MKKVVIMQILFLWAQFSLAATTEIWQGSGELFNIQGNVIGKYSLAIENTIISDTKTRRNVTITAADGRVEKIKCMVVKGAKGWSSDCSNGHGGGQCFGEGLCHSYVKKGNKAYATTIVMDGPNEMRLLRTELVNGKATHIFREKMQK